MTYETLHPLSIARRARRVALIWIAAAGVAYGLGALKGIEERNNEAARNEAHMAQRIADKQWAGLQERAQYMTGIPATPMERK